MGNGFDRGLLERRQLLAADQREGLPPKFHFEQYLGKTYWEVRDLVKAEKRWRAAGNEQKRWVRNNWDHPAVQEFKQKGIYFHFFADTPDEINGEVCFMDADGRYAGFKDWGDNNWNPANRVVFIEG